MPVAGGAGGGIRSSSHVKRRQQHSVQLNLPQSASGEHHQPGYQGQYRDEAGSRTPGSQHQHQHQHQHQNQATPKHLSMSALMMLKRRLREARGRLQAQQQQALMSRGKCENTYVTQPQSPAFQTPSVVRQVLENSLHFFLGDNLHYCPRACAKLVRMVTDDAKRRLKVAIGSHRFKIIVTAAVMQKARQGACEASRCLTDGSCDNFVTACLETPTFMASATAYWFYHE